MSIQSNLYSLPSVATTRSSRLNNQQIFKEQRRFSAMTRNLTPAQKEQVFQNMQVFIASECQGNRTPGQAPTPHHSQAPTPSKRPSTAELSTREQEVLVLVSNGYSRREIGDALEISVNTAARHISNIYRKLGVTSVAEATRYAMGH